MSYEAIEERIAAKQLVVIDGGIGTELERRGVPMDKQSWSGTANLEQSDVLEQIHVDYVEAGARIITANTFSTLRPMLEAAGYWDRVGDVNRAAIETALRARERAGVDGVVVAGSLSHWTEGYGGMMPPSTQELTDVFGEMALMMVEEGVDLILCEMMYLPQRIELVVSTALETGLPVWAGLSARQGEDGSLLSFAQGQDIPFAEILAVANRPGLAAMGVMHTGSPIVSGAMAAIRQDFDGPVYAYPDSGMFEMPNWRFDDSLTPAKLADYGKQWVAEGINGIGGCCGLSPTHIKAVADLA
jgi:homocysteine S-methyltransferase